MTPKIIKIEVPRSWADLDDSQLYYVYGLIGENLSGDQIKTFCLFRWGRLSIICRYGDGFLIRRAGQEFYATAETVASAIHALDYLENITPTPVRIRVIRGHHAADALMTGVPFERYLYIENLYQGYLHTMDYNLLTQMAQMLYDAEDLKLNKAEKMSTFYWWTALKQYLAREFPHFFTDAPAAEAALAKPLRKQLREAMDAQIRALTKGDITKEQQVLQMDTWRALTELDALAREAEELNRKYGKH